MCFKKPFTVILVITISLLLSSCRPGQAFGPKITPSPTATNTPLPTPTRTPTPEPTATNTPFPTATFPVTQMSNPAFQIKDIKVTVEGELVTAIFYLQDVPEELTFHRTGTTSYQQNYSWAIWIDIPNDLNPGSDSEESQGSVTTYGLYATEINQLGKNETIPIEKAVQVSVITFNETSSTSESLGNIEVDPVENTIKISGIIPGVKDDSQFFFEVFDANPGGQEEHSYGEFIDRVAFIDTSTIEPTATKTLPLTTPFPITNMSNSSFNVIDLRVNVQGELVTAVFYLEDVPEKMDFYRTGVPQDVQEYAWTILINTDNDINTGYNYEGVQSPGTDYELVASSSIYPDGQSESIPIEYGARAEVRFFNEGRMYIASDGGIKVDTDANTITISGFVPGVTENSQFSFEVFDWNPEGQIESSSGQISDRVEFSK